MARLVAGFVAIALAIGLRPASAECPNACSGHGVCSSRFDYCDCYRNWQGADCSQRTCPSAIAFADGAFGDINSDGTVASSHTLTYSSNTADYQVNVAELHPVTVVGIPANAATAALPTAAVTAQYHTGEAHYYAECSNKGLCDRTTGLCQCFDGYEGSACTRTACPAACSGHGRCVAVGDLDKDTKYYSGWESYKNRKCVCDKGWDGYDCSMRLCPKGYDPVANARITTYEVQRILSSNVVCSAATAKPVNITLNLLYTDEFSQVWEVPPFHHVSIGAGVQEVSAGTAAANLKAALEAVPHGKIPSVTVTASTPSDDNFQYLITFSGIMFDVNPLTLKSIVVNNACGDTSIVAGDIAISTPTTMSPVVAAGECSSRGLCDYTTGLCKCFRGYTGPACSSQNTLAE